MPADLTHVGFWGFTAATFVAGTVDCGWYTNDKRGLANAFMMLGGFAQLFAGIWDGVIGRSAAGATILCAFGFYWIAEGLEMLPTNTQAPSRYHGNEYRLLLANYKLCWVLFVVPMVYIMARKSMCHGVCLFCVLMALVFQLVAGFKGAPGDSNLIKISGYFMIIAAALAYYMSVGLYLLSSGYNCLPFGPPIIQGPAPFANQATEKENSVHQQYSGTKDLNVIIS